MMKFQRNGILLLSAMVLATFAMGGCSKKMKVADVTQGEQEGGKKEDMNGGSSTKDPNATETPHDMVESDPSVKDVFFSYDDYTLSAEARSALGSNFSYFKEMSGMRVTIEGHCDERGTVEYNLALGQRRADAAKSYLVNLGMDSGRMSTISYGEERPFDPGHDESSWSQNRRAHFVVRQ